MENFRLLLDQENRFRKTESSTRRDSDRSQTKIKQILHWDGLITAYRKVSYILILETVFSGKY